MEPHIIECLRDSTDFITVTTDSKVSEVIIEGYEQNYDDDREEHDRTTVYLDIDKTKELIFVLQEALEELKTRI